jgi:RHS repeat-associated protein
VNSFTYDSLRRLTAATAVTSGTTAWSQTYSYDGFGNLTAKSAGPGGLSGLTFINPVDPTTNRLAGGTFCYDPDGNLTSDLSGGGCSNPNYGYDVANRMVSAQVSGGTEYNKRISKVTSNGSQTIYIYGAMGEKLAEVTGSFEVISNNVYFAGRLIKENTDQFSFGAPAQYPDNNFVGIDRLGSVKHDPDGTGTRFLPYGEETTPTENDVIKFASYTRDGSTGLDYADQRFFTSQFGRFMSADRFRQAANATSSGSWNKYSYVQNDPVNLMDPSGRDFCDPWEDPEDCYPDPCTESELSACGIDPGPGPGPGPDPAAPSCNISVAYSGTPKNGQSLVGLVPYSPQTNTLGAYSTTKQSGLAPRFRGWFFGVQIQGTLSGDTNAADWTATQSLVQSGTFQVSTLGGGTTTQSANKNRPDDNPLGPAIFAGTGIFDWLDVPGFGQYQPGGGIVVGASITFNYTSTLTDGSASCSVNWKLTLTGSGASISMGRWTSAMDRL